MVCGENGDQLKDSLVYSRAYWVSESIIAWNVDVGTNGSSYLFASQNASLSVMEDDNDGIQGTVSALEYVYFTNGDLDSVKIFIFMVLLALCNRA